MYLATEEQQNKWNTSSVRNWFEIYPQLSIFFKEIMAKYEKLLKRNWWVYTVYFILSLII